ncbi:MAG: CRP/FNR family transcriptional regulator [Chloroflexi bacterium]|nr:MAG: CRP/FNR family transcriptional regulator [Chloroflexota bacterium]
MLMTTQPDSASSSPLTLVPLFLGMTPALLGELSRKLRPVAFRSGTAIFHSDDVGSMMYIIIKGAVKIFVPATDGREVVLAVHRTGDLFGEMSLLDDERRSASASTLEDTEMVSLSRQDFQDVLERHPDACRAILDVLVKRLRQTNQSIQDAYLLDVPGRLARRLLILARDHGIPGEDGGVEIGLRVSQQDLASMIGASRVAVNKQLQNWRQAGIVDVRRQRVTVLKPEALERQFSLAP